MSLIQKVIIALVLVIGVICLLFQRGERVALSSLPSDTVIMFSKTGCSHCREAMAFIDTVVRREYPDVPIHILNVDTSDNMAKLWAVVRHHRLNPERVGTPLIVINDRVMMGWTKNHEKLLLSAIRALSQKSLDNRDKIG